MFREGNSKVYLHNANILLFFDIFLQEQLKYEATVYKLYLCKQITVLLRMFYWPYLVAEPGLKLIFIGQCQGKKRLIVY